MSNDRLLQYRLGATLSRDWRGTVYEGFDERLKREIVLRLLPSEVSADSRVIERLERDAAASAELNHPHIGQTFELGEHDARHFLVSELVKGRTLAERTAEGSLEPEALLDLALQLVDALESAHAKGVLHLNLGPDSVVVDEHDHATIVHFGLASVWATWPESGEAPSRYVAPELADGGNGDARSDLFSLGVVLEEAASTGVSDVDRPEPSPPLASRGRSSEGPNGLERLPEKLDRIASRLVERDPDLRYQSAADLRAELKRLKRDTSVAALDSTPPRGPASSSPARGRLKPGRKLGPYEIEDLIGEGGMGEIYRARDPRLDRDVAIKIVSADFVEQEHRLERFEREARAVAALSHPNILAVFDVGEDEGVYYVVTELLEGRTLRECLNEGALPVDKAVSFAIEIAAGVGAAHSKAIIHRDLKPANVFITEEGRVKILDFGLAKFGDATSLELAESAPSPTMPGEVLGTAGYMAPEQVRGEEADQRSDIFSIGTMLYEMFTGKRAFAGNSGVERMHAILKYDPPPVQDLEPDVSPFLSQITQRCLEKDPGQRFQSVRDLSFALGSPGSSSEILRKSPDTANEESAERKPSIAVLPFTDMSSQKDQEYFCDGIAEEVLNALTRCDNLKIVARTSAFRFKGKSEDIRVIGQKLGVSTLVEGSVRTAGDRLRITAKLINVGDGYQLWSEQYDRELDDVFAIQDEIAQRIVSSLELKLLHKEEPSEKRRTDIRAYRSYLKARFHMSERTVSALERGVWYCTQALEIDPSYASAHACLADCLFLLAFLGAARPQEVMPRAKAAAQKAIELEGSLGEAHTSLGCILATYDWDWERSGQAFRRALELNPGSAMAHYWYAMWNLIPQGRFGEAAREIDAAKDLDPLSLVLKAGRGWQLYFARDHDRAVDEAGKAVEMDAGFLMGYDVAAQAHGQLGDYETAVSEARKAESLSEQRTLSLGILGHLFGVAGDKAAGEEVLKRLLDSRRDGYGSAYDIALVQTGLGDFDEAFRWLEQAYEERNGLLVFLGVEPRFDPLRSDERFRTLVARLGL